MIINFFKNLKKYEERLLNRLSQKRFPHFCSIKFSDKSKQFLAKRVWDRNRSFVRIRFRRPTSAQLSRAVKADEISVVEPTQPLRLARQSKNN